MATLERRATKRKHFATKKIFSRAQTFAPNNFFPKTFPTTYLPTYLKKEGGWKVGR